MEEGGREKSVDGLIEGEAKVYTGERGGKRKDGPVECG